MDDLSLKLAGKWVVDSSDHRAVRDLGNVLMEFGEKGDLIYAVYQGDAVQIINMQYFIDGDVIVTDQPSARREERSAFYFLDVDRLAIKFDDTEYRFLRLSEDNV